MMWKFFFFLNGAGEEVASWLVVFPHWFRQWTYHIYIYLLYIYILVKYSFLTRQNLLPGCSCECWIMSTYHFVKYYIFGQFKKLRQEQKKMGPLRYACKQTIVTYSEINQHYKRKLILKLINSLNYFSFSKLISSIAQNFSWQYQNKKYLSFSFYPCKSKTFHIANNTKSFSQKKKLSFIL
jgi:hypothetical protein